MTELKNQSQKNTESITSFLDEYYPSYNSLEKIAAGHHSSTHSFVFKNKKYIVRSSGDSENYQKDRIISKLTKQTLHVPEILLFKKFNNQYYCVQPKIEGITADNLSAENYKLLLPQIFDLLTKIHSLNVDEFQGYGSWNSTKVAPFETWVEYLDDVHNEKKWEDLANSTTFNIQLVEKLYARLIELIPNLNSEKVLIHGDFGRDNLLVLSQKISGIIDWGESKIGDRVYDIAWLDLWNPLLEISSNYQQFIKDEEIEVVNFQKRFEASLIEIAISSLEWTAEHLGNQDYQWLEKRVREALKV